MPQRSIAGYLKFFSIPVSSVFRSNTACICTCTCTSIVLQDWLVVGRYKTPWVQTQAKYTLYTKSRQFSSVINLPQCCERSYTFWRMFSWLVLNNMCSYCNLSFLTFDNGQEYFRQNNNTQPSEKNKSEETHNHLPGCWQIFPSATCVEN